MNKTKEIIKEIMEEHHLSQQALANKLGLGQKTISDWIIGKNLPNANSIIAIYENFGITPNELLGIEERKYTTITYNNSIHNGNNNINKK